MRNELKQFGYLQPTSVSDAVSLLTKYGGQARVIAGGTDLLYQMKQHIDLLTPQYVVDITGLNLERHKLQLELGPHDRSHHATSQTAQELRTSTVLPCARPARPPAIPRRSPTRRPWRATSPRRSGAGTCATTTTAGGTAGTSATHATATTATTTASSAATSATQCTRAT